MKKEKLNKKLLVHETNEGTGYFGIVGEEDTFSSYSYEDEETGDVASAVRVLIDIGFIDANDVLFVEGMEIYGHLKEEEED